tara:strand:- start:102 stop:464 length:363 start_codon:yes stop_codon:yes gene_type:complete
MYIVENNYTSLAHDRTEDEPTNRIKCHLKNLNQATCLPKRNNSHSKREEFGKHSGRQEWIEAEGRAGEVREAVFINQVSSIRILTQPPIGLMMAESYYLKRYYFLLDYFHSQSVVWLLSC